MQMTKKVQDTIKDMSLCFIVNTKEKSTINFKGLIIFLVAGILVASVPFAAGYILDDLRLDPLFWMRFEFSSPFHKAKELDSFGFEHSTVDWSFLKGNSGIFLNVKLLVNDGKIFEVGGDENCFFGFRDVDGDGTKEFLFTTTSKYGSHPLVCKWTGSSWTEIPETPMSIRIMRIARLMCYGWIIFGVGSFAALDAMLFIFLGIIHCRPTA